MADDVSGARRGASDYRWQGQESGSGAGSAPGARRRFWFIVLTGLLLASVSLVIVWVLLIQPPPPPPYFLSINIAEYNNKQFPVLAFASQDAERIRRHFPGKQQAATKTKELLRKELEGLAGRPEPTVIVHISALAVAREDKVFLLPADTEVENESQWVELREVVSAIAKCPSKNKLLILDLAHPLADARLGVLSDRVAETIEEHFTKEKPPFFVLCPCSAGQFSLTSDVLESSVLGYYLDQGLQGHADLDKDLGITVKELFTFVEARVDRWAQTNRGQRQKPRLFFGKADDFVVASAGKSAAPALENRDQDPYPSRLQDDWKERDLWWDKEAFRRAPRFLQKLEATLLRQERRWRGGAIAKNHVDSIDEDTKSLLNDLKRAMAAPKTPARSLAMAFAQAGTNENAVLIDTVLFQLAGAKDLGPAKDSAVKLAKLEEELTKKLQEPKTADFSEQAWAVIEALNRVGELKQDHLRLAQAALAHLKPKQRFIELLYVQRLVQFADGLKEKDPDTWRWPSEKVQAVLHTARSHHAVIGALNREPALLPWLGPLVDEGDKLRRSGEKKLLSDRPTTWKEAYQELQSAHESYKQALQMFDTLRRCRWDLDRSFAQLPAYARILCDGAEIDAHGESAWDKAAKVAKDLQKFFAEAPELGAAGAKSKVSALTLDNYARDLNRHLQDLEDMLARRIARAKKDDHAETLPQLVLLLESPLLKAPERSTLFRKHRELAAKLQELTDKQDQEDNRQSRVSALPDAPPTLQQKNRGLVRAAMALGLLRLAGIEAQEKKFDLPPLDRNVTAAEWANLERALHQAWSKDLVSQWHHPRSPGSADVLNRTVSPWVSEKRAGGVDKDASRVLQKNVRGSFLDWLQERYQAEGRFLEATSQDQPAGVFYLDAARELRLHGSE